MGYGTLGAKSVNRRWDTLHRTDTHSVVLADTFYGRSHDFRETVRVYGLDYAVAIEGAPGGMGRRYE
jgi:hypothetical protein